MHLFVLYTYGSYGEFSKVINIVMINEQFEHSLQPVHVI